MTSHRLPRTARATEMDFQLHQEEAKQNTVKLMALLALGVLAIVLVVSALLVGLFYYD